MGVVRDVYGNPLAAMNTKSDYNWFFKAETNRDSWSPSVAFWDAPTISTNGSIIQVQGDIFFTERVVSRGANYPLNIVDCGTDFVCNNADDTQTPMTGMDLSFGSGAAKSSTEHYGLLRYSETLPYTNRRYRVVVPPYSVSDVQFPGSQTSSVNVGPGDEKYLQFEVGTIVTTEGVDEDIASPTVVHSIPFGSQTPVSKSSSITLYFNEDVSMGSGEITFCLGSMPTSASAMTCAADPPARFTDESEAIFNTTNDAHTLDRRVLSMTLSKDFKVGQTLYAIIPEGLVTDLSLATYSLAANGGRTGPYSFSIMEEDTIKPQILYAVPDTSGSNYPMIEATGSVVLHFSEAIQSSEIGDVNVTEIGAGQIMNFSSATILGNKVTFSYQWTSGSKYIIDLKSNTIFKDLQGNYMNSPSLSTFVINANDATAPSFSKTDSTSDSTKLSSTAVFALTFSEVVQKGTGKVSIYSYSPSGANLGKVEEFLVENLPLMIAETVSPSKHARSETVVEPSNPLVPGFKYVLRIPSQAFQDPIGNQFTALNALSDTYAFTVATKKDCEEPRFLTANLGGGASPNPAFPVTNQIVMYFSEHVQKLSTGSIWLQPSTGGNYCSSGGTCIPGATCNVACGYTQADVARELDSWQIEGSRVTASSNFLQVGKGYKLVIEKGAFADQVGNSLSNAVDGEGTGGVFVLQVDAPPEDSTGPSHVTIGPPNGPPILSEEFPLHGSTMVHPSTSIQVTFNEVVQAGTGDVTLTDWNLDDSDPFTQKVSVSHCGFSVRKMVCKSPADLQRKRKYEFSYSEVAVKDAVGNTMVKGATVGNTNSKLQFTTIDFDYTEPALAAQNGNSFAVVGTENQIGSELEFSKPFDPPDGALNVAPGTVIALSFSETVQAGSGSIVLRPTHGSSGLVSIDVTGTTSGTAISWLGKSVFIQKPELARDTNYTIETTKCGVFKDLSLQPLANITNGPTFHVVPADVEAPLLLQMTPDDDITQADDAPSTILTLYFSEAIQQATGNSKFILLSPMGGTAAQIPVDNSNPTKGTVSIVGTRAMVDPFDEIGYDKTVFLTVGNDAFVDLFGANKFVQKTGGYRFRTIPFTFVEKQKNSAANLFTQRGGMAFYSMRRGDGVEYLLLYGGLKGTTCLGDAFTSTTGETWSAVTVESSNTSGTVPAVAYPKASQDKDGCIWMMGSGYSCLSTSTIWMSCGIDDSGVLKWWPLPTPSAVDIYDNPIPWKYEKEELQGHAIVIVGGWMLIVLDAEQGFIWKFLDQEGNRAQRLRYEVPFALRTDPILLASSDQNLFMMGGYDKAACAPGEIYCKDVYTDLWKSSNYGWTWECLTSHYDQLTVTLYSKGIGRHVGALMTHDDTIFLIGGAQPNGTVGLNTVWSSYTETNDTVKPDDYGLSMSPSHGDTNVLTSSKVMMYFHESVFLRAPSPSNSPPAQIRLEDLTNSDNLLPITTELVRQVLTVRVKDKNFSAGSTVKVVVPATALQDAAGNTLAATREYQFTTHADIYRPYVTQVVTSVSPLIVGLQTQDRRVAPWTNVVLHFSEHIFAEKGRSGRIEFTSSLGEPVFLDLGAATIQNQVGIGGKTSSIFFPAGANFTENTEYSLKVPAGLVIDEAGNPNWEHNTTKVKILSGEFTMRNYADRFSDASGSVGMPISFTNDAAKPAFVSMWPRVNSGDVKVSEDVAVYLFFDKPVRFNHSGTISILNSSDKVVGAFNVTYQQQVAMNPALGHLTSMNATKVKVGSFLQPGVTFTVSVPEGVIKGINGQPVEAIVKSFSCLAENRDTVDPVVVMTEPHQGNLAVLSSTSKFTLWFSEKIQRGSGSVTLRHTGTDADVAFLDVTHENTTIEASTVTFGFFRGVLTPAFGVWNLIVPPGIVKDVHGVQFRGLNNTIGSPTFDFTVIIADTTKPTILAKLPTHESTKLYEKPSSQAFQITFTEHVQAAVKYRHVSTEEGYADAWKVPSVRIRPMFTSLSAFSRETHFPVTDLEHCTGEYFEDGLIAWNKRTRPPPGTPCTGQCVLDPGRWGDTWCWTEPEGTYRQQWGAPCFPCEHPQIHIHGSQMVVAPAVDLLPGESYSLQIDSGAIQDLEGNFFDGLRSGYTISTKSFIRFRKAQPSGKPPGSGFFDSGLDDYFNGERHGPGVAVDRNNNIWVAGGQNGTQQSLNDVWKFMTARPVHCASSKLPVDECTIDGKKASNLNAVTECDGELGQFAGRANYEIKVWKAVSANGRPCINSNGEPASKVGELLETGFTRCPCPSCMNPPNVTATFPEQIDLQDSTFQTQLPMRANNSELQWQCLPGWRPANNFVCEFKSLKEGAFKKPFPECEQLPCLAVPKGTGLLQVMQDSQCSNSLAEMPHDTRCKYVCPVGHMATNVETKRRLEADSRRLLTSCTMVCTDYRNGAVLKGGLEGQNKLCVGQEGNRAPCIPPNPGDGRCPGNMEECDNFAPGKSIPDTTPAPQACETVCQEFTNGAESEWMPMLCVGQKGDSINSSKNNSMMACYPPNPGDGKCSSDHKTCMMAPTTTTTLEPTAPPEPCNCETPCVDYGFGDWCYVDAYPCLTRKPCDVDEGATECVNLEDGRPWIRCTNLLQQEDCECQNACEDDGAGAWCYVQSPSCNVRKPCMMGGSAISCISVYETRFWTRCANIFDAIHHWDGHYSCNYGNWALEGPNSCKRMHCHVGDVNTSTWMCKAEDEDSWLPLAGAMPEYKMVCRVPCNATGSDVEYICDIGDGDASSHRWPFLQLLPGQAPCPGLSITTAEPTFAIPTTTTGSPENESNATVEPNGTNMVLVTLVRSSLTLSMTFEDDTAEAMMGNEGFQDSLKKSVAAGAGKLTAELVTAEDITIEDLVLEIEEATPDSTVNTNATDTSDDASSGNVSGADGNESGATRKLTLGLRIPQRRLAKGALTVAYAIRVSNEDLADQMVAALSDPEKRASFEQSFGEQYRVAETVRTGTDPGPVAVTQSETADFETVWIEITTAAPTNITTTSTTTTTDMFGLAALPQLDSEFLRGAAFGAVAGAVVALLLLGICVCMYRRRKAGKPMCPCTPCCKKCCRCICRCCKRCCQKCPCKCCKPKPKPSPDEGDVDPALADPDGKAIEDAKGNQDPMLVDASPGPPVKKSKCSCCKRKKKGDAAAASAGDTKAADGAAMPAIELPAGTAPDKEDNQV
jgi:hypothetical protein